MPTMSYCLFENTSKDMMDCVDELYELKSTTELTDEKRKYAIELYKLCRDYVRGFDVRSEDDENF